MASPEVGRLRGEDLFHSSSSPPSPHLHNHFSTRNAHESEPHSDLFATTRQEQMPPFSFCVSSQGQPYYEDTSPPFLSKQQEPTSTSTTTTTSKSTHAPPPFCTNLHLMGNNNNTNPPPPLSSSSSSSSTHMHLMDNSKINPSPLSSSSSSFSTYMHLMGNSKVCSPPLTSSSSSCTHMHLMGDSKVHPPPLSSFSSSPSSFPFSSSISGCHTPDWRTKTMSVKEEDYESGRMVGKSQSMRLLNAYREENEMLRRALFYSLRRAQEEEEEEEEEELPIPPPSIFGHSSNIFSDPFQGRTKSMMEVGRWGHVGSSSSLESHFVPPPWMNPYPLEEPKIFNHHHLSSPSSNPHSGFFNMGNYSNSTNNPYILGEYSSSPSYGEHQANLYSSSSPLGSRRKKKKKKEVEIASPHTMMLNMKKTPPTTNVGGRVDAIVSREDRGARYSTSIDKLDKLSKRDFDNPQQETYLQGLEEEGQCVMCGNRLFFVGGSRDEQTQGGLPLKLCSSCHPHHHPHPRHNIPLNPSKPTHLSSTHHLNNKGQVGRSSSSTTMPSRTPHPPTSISISMACMPSASSSSTSSGSLYGKKKKAGFLDLCKHFLGLTTTIKT